MCIYHRSVLDLDSEPFVGGGGDRCANLDKSCHNLDVQGLIMAAICYLFKPMTRWSTNFKPVTHVPYGLKLGA